VTQLGMPTGKNMQATFLIASITGARLASGS